MLSHRNSSSLDGVEVDTVIELTRLWFFSEVKQSLRCGELP
jgi:hypothetical protein